MTVVRAILKVFAYGLLSLPFILLTLFITVLVGGALAAFLLLGRTSPLKVMFTYPVTASGTERLVAVSIAGGETTRDAPGADVAREILDKGRFEGSLQLLVGPTDLKLFTTNVVVGVPLDEIIHIIAQDMFKEGDPGGPDSKEYPSPSGKGPGDVDGLDPSTLLGLSDREFETQLMEVFGLRSRTELLETFGAGSTGELRELFKQGRERVIELMLRGKLRGLMDEMSRDNKSNGNHR